MKRRAVEDTRLNFPSECSCEDRTLPQFIYKELALRASFRWSNMLTACLRPRGHTIHRVSRLTKRETQCSKARSWWQGDRKGVDGSQLPSVLDSLMLQPCSKGPELSFQSSVDSPSHLIHITPINQLLQSTDRCSNSFGEAHGDQLSKGNLFIGTDVASLLFRLLFTRLVCYELNSTSPHK